MGRTARYLTQDDKASAKALQKAAWERTQGGRITRQKQRLANSRRHTTVRRLPRLPPLPSMVYRWLNCPEFSNYSKQPGFRKALHDDYDTTPISHWLEDPLFEVPEEYQSRSAGPRYRAETQQMVYAVHARRMREVQIREAERRQLEERMGHADAVGAWRNQAQCLLHRWQLHVVSKLQL
uniref:Uncharacterized protein n=1 Tax=Mycena chlorophos TaxID=658473 RepID=A0ABQ0LEN6_MYCCL|nr:predicted protein [Mycena chlorophos]